MAAWRWVFMGPESSREPRVRANRRAVFGLQPRHQVFDVDLEQPKPVVGHVLAGLRPVLGVELVEERLELRPRGCGVAALERRLRLAELDLEAVTDAIGRDPVKLAAPRGQPAYPSQQAGRRWYVNRLDPDRKPGEAVVFDPWGLGHPIFVRRAHRRRVVAPFNPEPRDPWEAACAELEPRSRYPWRDVLLPRRGAPERNGIARLWSHSHPGVSRLGSTNADDRCSRLNDEHACVLLACRVNRQRVAKEQHPAGGVIARAIDAGVRHEAIPARPWNHLGGCDPRRETQHRGPRRGPETNLHHNLHHNLRNRRW